MKRSHKGYFLPLLWVAAGTKQMTFRSVDAEGSDHFFSEGLSKRAGKRRLPLRF